MKNRLYPMLAATVVAIAWMIGGAATAGAQITCQCDRMQVVVSGELSCSVTVCVVRNGASDCRTFGPGEAGLMVCPNNGKVVIADGCGNRREIGFGQCVTAIPGPAPCCFTACLNVDQDGCHILTISKTPFIGHCFCPGG